MQEDVAGDGTSGLKCVTLTLKIPAWPKGGPLSAGSARPAKSRYQRWWWHTQCQWNNYPEGDYAARSLWSGSTLRCQVFHICLQVIINVRDNIGFQWNPMLTMTPYVIPDHHMLNMEPFHAQHLVVWQYQPHDQWLYLGKFQELHFSRWNGHYVVKKQLLSWNPASAWLQVLQNCPVINNFQVTDTLGGTTYHRPAWSHGYF